MKKCVPHSGFRGDSSFINHVGYSASMQALCSRRANRGFRTDPSKTLPSTKKRARVAQKNLTRRRALLHKLSSVIENKNSDTLMMKKEEHVSCWVSHT